MMEMDFPPDPIMCRSARHEQCGCGSFSTTSQGVFAQWRQLKCWDCGTVQPKVPPKVPPLIKHGKGYEKALRTSYLNPLFRDVQRRLATVTAVNQAYYALEQGITAFQALPNAGIPTPLIADALERVNGHNYDQLRRTFRNALAIDIRPYLMDAPVRELVRQKIGENVALIKTIPKRMHTSLRARMEMEFLEAPFDQQRMSKLLSLEYKSSGYNLWRLTRDQTSKMNGELAKIRQQQVGVQQYVWRTSGDERVRPTHSANGGQIFEWGNPPPATGHRGDDIQCRCVAEPVVPSRPVQAEQRRNFEGATVQPESWKRLSHTASASAVDSSYRHRALPGYIDQYENAALADYTATGYQTANRALRTQSKLSIEDQAMHKALQEASAPLGTDIMLHRSVGHSRASLDTLDDVGKAWMDPKVGDVLHDRAFVSHSLAPQNAEMFMNCWQPAKVGHFC